MVTEGYLHLDVNIDEWIGFTLSGLALLSQCVIFFIAISQMMKKERVALKFKLLFTASFICSSTLTICSMATYLYFDNFEPATFALVGGLTLTAGCDFYVCLLAILVLRLKVTFGDSIYKMSTRTFHFFICILVILLILSTAVATLMSLVVMLYGIDPLWDSNATYPTWCDLSVGYLALFFIFLFVLGSVVAVFHFVNNLKLLSMTMSELPTPTNIEKESSLNANQRRYSDLSARYLLLFGIATTSTLMAAVLIFAFSLSSGMRQVFGTADAVVNLLCIYLQFSFATKHYEICCGCLDRRARKIMGRYNKKMINESPRAINVMHTISVASESEATNTNRANI